MRHTYQLLPNWFLPFIRSKFIDRCQKERMAMKIAVGLAFFAASLCSGGAMADQDCKDALVRSSLQYQHSHDYRLAALVTREVYDEQKKGGGFSATIYGVPVSANYD